MTLIHEIHLDRETANDDEGIVVAIRVPSGERVARGDVIFEVEHSKATMEVQAEADGFVVHDLTVGSTVLFGARIASIVDELSHAPAPLADAPGEPVQAAAVSAPAAPAALPLAENGAASSFKATSRFSRAAAALAHQHRLTERDFSADLISLDDVRSRIEQRPPPRAPSHDARQAPKLAVEVASRTAITARKAEEIKSLTVGGAVQSTLGIQLGRVQSNHARGTIFEDRILDIVVYEASRLMRSYPKLNAAIVGNDVCVYAPVNAGVAFDDGANLVVYGIENSDKKGLGEIRGEIEDALGRYLERRLSAREMTSATFTVTDLTSGRLDFVHPILPANQACIVGITRNPRGEFALFVGFDHRISEGREVGLFLSELADRVGSFHQAGGAEPAPRCAFCGASVAETVAFGNRGLLKVVTHGGAEEFCCSNCWDGS